MSFRLEMLQAARRAPARLGESADLVRQFVRGQQLPDGSFRDRSGRSDIYYTVFGLDCLLALDEPLPTGLEDYLRRFGGGEPLDFVHFTCLARCWSVLQPPAALAQRLVAFPPPQTVYDCYLALGAHEDLRAPLPDTGPWLRRLESLRSQDGAYGNAPGLPLGSTLATAAAAVLLRRLGEPVPAGLAPWLLAQGRPAGGFAAMPRAPMPDLLSTATALHALAGLGAPLDRIKEPCLDFLDSLWSNEGGFHGHWADEPLDVEYTSYALLALGHLA
jgi:prenyltransferase beta subunit